MGAVTVMDFVCGRSSTGRPDWTCIVLGFTSGSVRFYTEVSAVPSGQTPGWRGASCGPPGCDSVPACGPSAADALWGEAGREGGGRKSW